jgi:hypothetical protein
MFYCNIEYLQNKMMIEKYKEKINSIQPKRNKEHYSEPIHSHQINGTVLCHFYNEEYLLPFWIHHHKSIFKHGIMINYHSTDKSVEIISKLCPSWEICTTNNQNFDAQLVDDEVKQIEESISGYKMILNVTEFVISAKPFDRNDTNCFRVSAYVALPTVINTNPSTIHEFINSIQMLQTNHNRGYRIIHSHQNGNYTLGRHSTMHPSEESDGLFIIWTGFYPWNEFTIQRKLQIQTQIPESDKRDGKGFQHLWNTDRMEQELQKFLNNKDGHILLRNLYSQHNQRESYSPMEKTKVKVVVLVLASNQPIYQQARKIWKKYMYKDETCKVFFVYGKLENKLDNIDEHDLIYHDLEENYPNMIYKRIRAMEYIHQQYDYDYFIHTNISTFWDWNELHNHLAILPKQLCYSGDGPLPGYNENGYYLSGTDTIVTPDMIDSLLKNQHKLKFDLYEDQTLGSYFHGELHAPMLVNRICFLEDIRDNEDDKVIQIIQNAKKEHKDHYRVKTLGGDRAKIDAMIYQHLLEIIYP